jgi:nucleoside-diphosphate-sugar epimerase
MARQDLGFEAKVSFEDGLRALADWWQRECQHLEVTA